MECEPLLNNKEEIENNAMKFIPLFTPTRDLLQLKLQSSSNVSILHYHYDVQYIAIVTQAGCLLNYLFVLFVSQLSLTALNIL